MGFFADIVRDSRGPTQHGSAPVATHEAAAPGMAGLPNAEETLAARAPLASSREDTPVEPPLHHVLAREGRSADTSSAAQWTGHAGTSSPGQYPDGAEAASDRYEAPDRISARGPLAVSRESAPVGPPPPSSNSPRPERSAETAQDLGDSQDTTPWAAEPRAEGEPHLRSPSQPPASSTSLARSWIAGQEMSHAGTRSPARNQDAEQPGAAWASEQHPDGTESGAAPVSRQHLDGTMSAGRTETQPEAGRAGRDAGATIWMTGKRSRSPESAEPPLPDTRQRPDEVELVPIDRAAPVADQDGAPARSPRRHQAETALAGPRPPAVPATPQGQDPGPRVHIGHIDIVVVAPQAPQPTSTPARNNLASRSYLRSL
jgi:hypothetical protein